MVRCDNSVLYDRLVERGYNPEKLKSNIECEIFMEILNEAMDSYDPEIVHELRGETNDDFAESMRIVELSIKKHDT